jgi:2-alkyl-3-oxoalkanoate reductase
LRVLVTGASGVVGRRVVPLLAAEGHVVTAAARTPEKRAALERAGAAAVDLDLFDPNAVARAVSGQDAVLNLATHIPASSFRIFLPGAWRENDRIRREASALLARQAAAAGVSRFIQESFAPIYVSRGEEWIDETDPVRTVRYNRTIPDAERSAEEFSGSGRTGVVLRFVAFYGPDARQLHDYVRFVRRGFAPLPGPPQAFISSVSHDDAARAAAAALALPEGIYNVADDEPVTHREFFDSLAHVLGVAPPKLPPAWITRAMGSLGELLARSLRISNRKLRDASSWRPQLPSVREGWPATLASMTRATFGGTLDAPDESGERSRL